MSETSETPRTDALEVPTPGYLQEIVFEGRPWWLVDAEDYRRLYGSHQQLELELSALRTVERLLELADQTTSPSTIREATSALSRHDGGRTEALEEALREVDGCFEAAYVEGLSERLSELDTGVGGIRDLIERRLLPARAAAIRALQSHPHSTDDKWMKTQDSGKHNEPQRCHYCGHEYSSPVSYHHSTEECRQNEALGGKNELVERLHEEAEHYTTQEDVMCPMDEAHETAALLREAASALARHAGGRNAGLEEAAMVGEIAVAVVKKSIADWCQSQIVPSHQGGGIAIESANHAYERVIGLLTAPCNPAP